MRIVTHNGHFHADELLAVATLLLKYPKAEVVRSRDEEVIESGDIVVDVGHVHDPSKLRFDHHQTAGAGAHENGIPYASFGLVWKEFGGEIAGGQEEALIIEEQLVMPVDALDNGIKLSAPLFKDVKEYSIGDYFESFASGSETLEDYERGFHVALELAAGLMSREIKRARESVLGRKEVERIYSESANKKIIVLPGHFHWKKALIPTEAQFVVYPHTNGLWAVQGIPKSHDTPFDRKKSLPSAWAGLNNGELVRASGVDDAVFCLREGWLAGARSQEGAQKLAEIALNS
jgi:uncharacterized UPF0160 family protein